MSTSTEVRLDRSAKLALFDGTPVRKVPFAPWPSFEADEVEAAAAVLRSGKINYWTGSEGGAFEREFAAYTGCRYAVALANGTLALELALHALDIGPGDEVITTSRTFIASASCAVMRGATPVCADVDRDSGNITADIIRGALTPRTRAVVAVHLAGWPCDMEPILRLARERGLKVIEDCAQAHGATYKGRLVGSLGDAAAFSFCQDKIMTTGGEGGMLTTNHPDIWERAWSFKDHGKSYRAAHHREDASGFRWLHESFGTNWRLTEMQSALGRALLPKLDARVDRRRENAATLSEHFAAIPALRVTTPPHEVRHSYYKYYVYLRPEKLREGWDGNRVVEAICAEGVPCFTGSCSEIYLERAFPASMRPKKRLPVAQELGNTSLMFLVHHTLTAADMVDTYRATEKVLSVASA
jgi:dTDP-4-amino-4,6-dideoxygalactose transaminase